MTGNKADKKWFEDNEKVLGLLRQLDVDSEEQFERSIAEVHKQIRLKPIINGEELMMLPAEPDDYLIERLVWRGDVVILLASEKTGKSLLSVQMACAMTCGEHFLGEYEVPEQLKVLYIQAEGSREETQTRLKRMTEEGGFKWNPKNFFHMYPSALSLDTDAGFEDLADKIYNAEIHPDVIFLDPLYMAMEGDLIDNKRARLFCRNVRKLKERFGCTVIIVHHKRRPQKDKNGNVVDSGDGDIMGSFVWKAFPSHIINMSVRPDKIRTLTCETQRGGMTIKGMQLELVEPNPLKFIIHGTADCAPYVSSVYKYMVNAGAPQSAKMVISGTGISESAVRKSFSYLMENHKIFKTNIGHRPVLYTTIKEEA